MSRDFNYLLLYQESDNKRDCQPHTLSPSCIPVNREPFIAALCIVYEVYVKCRQVINELLPCFFSSSMYCIIALCAKIIH